MEEFWAPKKRLDVFESRIIQKKIRREARTVDGYDLKKTVLIVFFNLKLVDKEIFLAKSVVYIISWGF